MPAHIRKLPNRNKWEVVDDKGKIHAKATTKTNAVKQRNLLNGISHGWHPTGGKAK